ncbi:MAG: glycosyltransferase family 39 protein [Candidatus Pacearchaeota archaeon]
MKKTNDWLYACIIVVVFLIIYFLIFKFSEFDLTLLFSIYNLKPHFLKFALIFIVLAVFSYFISKDIEIKKIKTRKLIISIFLFSFILTILFWNSPQINPDSLRYLTFAKDFSTYGSNKIGISTDAPLIPFIYFILFKLLGKESIIAINIFTSLIYSFTAILIFLLSRKLFDEEIGFYSSLIFLGFNGILVQTGMILVDIPLVFFVALTIYTGINAFEKNKFSLFLLTFLFAVAAILTKISALLFFTPLLVLLLFRIENKRILLLIIGILSILICIIIFNIKSIIEIGRNALILKPFDFLIALSGLPALIFQFGPSFLLIFYGFLFLNKKERVFFYSWLLLPLIPLFLIAHEGAIFRYYMGAAPATAIISGLVISKLSKIKKNFALYVVLLILLSGLVISFGLISAIKDCGEVNLARAANYLNKNENVHTITVYANSSYFKDWDNKTVNPEPYVMLFDLYCDKDIVYGGNFGTDEYFKRGWEYYYKLPTIYYNETKLKGADAAILISDENTAPKNIENMKLVANFTSRNRMIMPHYIYVYSR